MIWELQKSRNLEIQNKLTSIIIKHRYIVRNPKIQKAEYPEIYTYKHAEFLEVKIYPIRKFKNCKSKQANIHKFRKQQSLTINNSAILKSKSLEILQWRNPELDILRNAEIPKRWKFRSCEIHTFRNSEMKKPTIPKRRNPEFWNSGNSEFHEFRQFGHSGNSKIRETRKFRKFRNS